MDRLHLQAAARRTAGAAPLVAKEEQSLDRAQPGAVPGTGAARLDDGGGKNEIESYLKMTIDTTNMCSHLQRKLFDENGEYHRLWLAMQDDPELTAVVRSRQLHIYRNGKKILVLAGKATPKVIREDKLCEMVKN